MFNFGWWKNESNSKAITAIINVAKVVVPAGVVAAGAFAVLLGYGGDAGPKAAPTPTISVTNGGNVQTGDGTLIVQGNGGTVIVGYTIEQHQDILKNRETELRTDLARATVAERALIEQQLQAVAIKLSDVTVSYHAAVEELQQLREKLGAFEGEVPSEQLEAARQALSAGDRSLADSLFAQVEADSADEVRRAASAAAARGSIAEEEIRWTDAAEHYTRAARLDPTFRRLQYAHGFSLVSGNFRQADYLVQELLIAAEASGDSMYMRIAERAYAETLTALGHLDKAEATYRDILAQLDRELGRNQQEPAFAPGGLDGVEYAQVLGELAGVLGKTNQLAEAEKLHREALNIIVPIVGEGDNGYAAMQNNLGNLLRQQGRAEEAEPLIRGALETLGPRLGDAHPHQAAMLGNLGIVLRELGRFEEAVAHQTKALDILKISLGKNHPEYALQVNNLAKHFQYMGRHEEAEALFRQALAIYQETLGPDHPSTQHVQDNLSRLLTEAANP